MKSSYLLIVIAGALICGCAERPSGSAFPEGQTYGLAGEAARGTDPTNRFASPSGRYGRPSSGSPLPAKASDVR